MKRFKYDKFLFKYFFKGCIPFHKDLKVTKYSFSFIIFKMKLGKKRGKYEKRIPFRRNKRVTSK